MSAPLLNEGGKTLWDEAVDGLRIQGSKTQWEIVALYHDCCHDCYLKNFSLLENI